MAVQCMFFREKNFLSRVAAESYRGLQLRIVNFRYRFLACLEEQPYRREVHVNQIEAGGERFPMVQGGAPKLDPNIQHVQSNERKRRKRRRRAASTGGHSVARLTYCRHFISPTVNTRNRECFVRGKLPADSSPAGFPYFCLMPMLIPDHPGSTARSMYASDCRERTRAEPVDQIKQTEIGEGYHHHRAIGTPRQASITQREGVETNSVIAPSFSSDPDSLSGVPIPRVAVSMSPNNLPFIIIRLQDV